MSQPSNRVSGPVKPRQATFPQRLLARTIHLFVEGAALTQRFRLEDPQRALDASRDGPCIFAIWHNRLAFSLVIHRRFVRDRIPGRRLAAMVSASRDGAMLAGVLEAFDVEPVRGSSSRRGAQALLELKSWADRGLDLAITPDGPRGPRYVVQTGVVALAHVTRLPIIPTAYRLPWKIQIRSWDRFQVPIPFGRCEVTLGEPLRVEDGSESGIESARLELERRLISITRD